MALKVIGPRVLVEPLDNAGIGDDLRLEFGGVTFKAAKVLDSGILTVGHDKSLSAGTVRGIGKSRCPDCEDLVTPPVQIGDIVLTSRLSGQIVRVDGVEHWVLAVSDILAVWERDDVQYQHVAYGPREDGTIGPIDPKEVVNA